MEPRPQFPRQPVGPRPQEPGQPPAGGPPPQYAPPEPGPEQPGYPEGLDPAAYVAPPRTEYDYSPLDLAPPGQRRRRQLIAGAIGALSVLLVGALIVVGWILLRDDTPSSEDGDQHVAVATEAPGGGAADEGDANAEGTPPAAAEDDDADATSDAEPTKAPTKAPEPTEAPAAAVDAETLKAMLPDPSALPQGFDGGTDSERDMAGVVEALGGSRTAEQNLEKWGWTANVERAFSADPAAVEPGTATTVIVSLHGFKDAAAAADALPFYSDILANLGYEDIDAPDLGDSARLLQQPQEDGGVNVALYIQDGPVLYRIGGYAMGGDPAPTVIDVANAMLASE